jgi:plasmid maintenance system antidote protein VapI
MIMMNAPGRRPVDRLRAEIAAARIHAYKVASRIPIHPMTLSRILNGRLPLSDELAAKIRRAIAEEVRDGGPDVR